MTRLLTLALIIACIASAGARTIRTTRNVPRDRSVRTHTGQQEQYDTITAPIDSVTLSGYEKPLRSATESVFITNSSERHIIGVVITTAYYDMSGRLLHKATRRHTTDIPPGETRQITYRSWDIQKSFYYCGSPQPRVAAVPFDIKQRVDTLFTSPYKPDGTSD